MSEARPSTGHASSQPVDRPRQLAAVVCGLQGAVLVFLAGYVLYELAAGGSDSPTRGVMEAVLVAVFAAGLLALARGWAAGSNWPNTPTIVWNLLLLPVAWSLVQGDQGPLGLAVGAVAMLGIVSAIAADTSEP